MRRKSLGKSYNPIMERIKRISIFSKGKAAVIRGLSTLIPVNLKQSGSKSKGPRPIGMNAARILAALSIALIILPVVGCRHRKTKPGLDTPTADPYQKGYQAGITAGRSAYISEYGDMIRTCVSKNAVEAIYNASQKVKAENARLKGQLKGGIKFAKSCLAEQERLKNIIAEKQPATIPTCPKQGTKSKSKLRINKCEHYGLRCCLSPRQYRQN